MRSSPGNTTRGVRSGWACQQSGTALTARQRARSSSSRRAQPSWQRISDRAGQTGCVALDRTSIGQPALRDSEGVSSVSGREGHRAGWAMLLPFAASAPFWRPDSDARGQRDAECVSLRDLSCVVTEIVHSLHMRSLRNDSTCGRTVLLPVNVHFSAAPAAS